MHAERKKGMTVSMNIPRQIPETVEVLRTVQRGSDEQIPTCGFETAEENQ